MIHLHGRVPFLIVLAPCSQHAVTVAVGLHKHCFYPKILKKAIETNFGFSSKIDLA